MKKILIVFLLLFTVSYVFAAGDKTAQPQAAATPAADEINQDGLYSVGISNGLLFRFVSKNWSGIEIPLAINYTSGNSGDVMNDSISTGYGLVIPVKIIGGLHVNFIPELTGGYARTLSVTNNTDYNVITRLNETVNLTDSSYTITAGITFKLEVEYFIGHLISFLPGDISIGGNVAVSGTENYEENYTQTFNDYEVISKHTCFFGTNATLALTGTTLSTLVIRYYF